MHRSKNTPYSITSSAVASSVGGTVRPSILAVSALMTSSNLPRLHDRQVSGLGALEDAAGIDSELAEGIQKVGSVALKSADFGKITQRKCRGDRVVRRQLDYLDTPTAEEGVVADEEGFGPIARKNREGRIDLAAVAGVENLDLQAHGGSRRCQLSQRGLRIRSVGRIDEHGNPSDRGHQLTQEFQSLCRQLTKENIYPRQVAARPGEAGDKTESYRVFADGEDDGDRRGCRLGRNADPADATITATRRRTNSAASAGSRSN
jgi:hypothetical protein